MRALTILALAAVCLAMGCSSDSAAAVDPLAAMKLDDGKRWPSDAHTRQSVAAMIEEVRRADADRGVTTSALADRLQEQLDKLITGCTMQGAPHDALHTYLSVLMPQVEAMRQTNQAAAVRAREQVAKILQRFDTYFA